MQTEQLLCWSGVTDTEHRKTSGSNEEDQPASTQNLLFLIKKVNSMTHLTL